MTKGEYDTDDNGIVDNAELVNGFEVNSSVSLDAVFTDFQDATQVYFVEEIDIDGDSTYEIDV